MTGNTNMQQISTKSKSLKHAIKQYEVYKKFVDLYNSTKTLDEYISFLRKDFDSMSVSTVEKYNIMIQAYNMGNHEPLLTNLFYKLTNIDENKNNLARELKLLLEEL